MPIRIGLVGPRHAGKTSIADNLIDQNGFMRMSFASPVKMIYAEMFDHFQKRTGISTETFTVEDLEKNKEQHRLDLERFGTTHGRAANPDIWVNYLLERMNESFSDANIIVDDVRFMNEVQALQANGFVIFYVTRDKWNRLRSIVNDMLAGVRVPEELYYIFEEEAVKFLQGQKLPSEAELADIVDECDPIRLINEENQLAMSVEFVLRNSGYYEQKEDQ